LDESKELLEIELDEDKLAKWKETLKMAATAESPEKEMLLLDEARLCKMAIHSISCQLTGNLLTMLEKLADAFLNNGKHTLTEQDIFGNFLSKPEILVDLTLTARFF
jgi:hypothetical protein